MKKIITLLSMMLCLFATAQEVSDTMCIYRNDKTVVRIPISEIDSVVFAMFAAPEVPDTPVTPPSSSEYEAVDLGLPSGVKWASCNVGALKPEDCGSRYSWGETEEKTDYSWSTYKWSNGSDDTMTKYCTHSDYGVVDNLAILALDDDVANVKWGGDWRMPTEAEQYELRKVCRWEWTNVNGVNGYRVIGLNGNSIFLPTTGLLSDSELEDATSVGYYWSSTLCKDECSLTYTMCFEDSWIDRDYSGRAWGFCVRPVCGENRSPIVNYTVSVSASVGGSASIRGVGGTSVQLLPEERVNLIATANEGYAFVGWFVGDDETAVSIDAEYSFTVSASISLVAKFKKVRDLNGYEAVDLGLPSGLLWATCNVGASKPEECGGYYAWGETEEKTDYSWDTYKWCNNGRDEDLTKYCAESLSGTFDNKTLLEAEDDVATVKWGGSWRMPTRAEQDELRNECTWEWTELNGVYGCKVTGPNGNSIFLPAAGSRHDTRISYVGRYGYYWSSSLNDSVSYGFSTYYFYFDANYFNWDNCSREQGLSVRAVCD